MAMNCDDELVYNHADDLPDLNEVGLTIERKNFTWLVMEIYYIHA